MGLLMLLCLFNSIACELFQSVAGSGGVHVLVLWVLSHQFTSHFGFFDDDVAAFVG